MLSRATQERSEASGSSALRPAGSRDHGLGEGAPYPVPLSSSQRKGGGHKQPIRTAIIAAAGSADRSRGGVIPKCRPLERSSCGWDCEYVGRGPWSGSCWAARNYQSDTYGVGCRSRTRAGSEIATCGCAASVQSQKDLGDMERALARGFWSRQRASGSAPRPADTHEWL
jgi:hypothetical protein